MDAENPEPASHPEEIVDDSAFAPAGSTGLADSVTLLNSFTGPIEPPRISLVYQFSLLLVATFMVLLPVVYVGMVVTAGWGVVWYAQHFAWMLTTTGGGGRGMLLRLAIYVAPLFAGGLAVLFMFKPLFARRLQRFQPLTINPGAEPVLFAFICKLCDLVRAPLPAEIALAADVNASASLRQGLFSRELRLTIGMPLVAGLTVNQFAGVLAHEFGHFTQGIGMRLTYIIRRINGWFARVVFERDSWDVWLDGLTDESEHWAVSLGLALTHFAIGFSRFLLRLLMLLGNLVSCYALRRMEYGADEFEVKVVGSETFETTSLRLQVLGCAEAVSRQMLGQLWAAKQRVPDDLARFLHRTDLSLPPEKRNELENSLALEPTRWHDTHPSVADRVRAARQLGSPGVFHLDWPATSLFQNFDVLSRQVTLTFYRDEVGLPVTDDHLIPSSAPTEGAAKPPTGEAPRERPKIRLKVNPAPPPDAPT